MKYTVDLPLRLPANHPIEILVLGCKYFAKLVAAGPQPIAGKSADVWYWDEAQPRGEWTTHVHLSAHNPVGVVTAHVQPVKVDPAIEIRVGSEWETANTSRVKVINRHSDGDFEVTVLAQNGPTLPSDERRGMRAGSSYIVNACGQVRPGHLAPSPGMNLDRAIEAKQEVKPAPVFTIAQHDFIRNMIAEAVRASEAKVAMKSDVDAAIKAYDAQKLKIFAGKTYVTRNGSWVKIKSQSEDGSTTGMIVRGGTGRHGFHSLVFHLHDGRVTGTLTTDSALDLMHEVIGE